jgi:hypothetical protein
VNGIILELLFSPLSIRKFEKELFDLGVCGSGLDISNFNSFFL